jgi:molybdopterin-synthase adenylyltransferase
VPRPRLKDYARQVGADQITLFRDAGVEITLADPDGKVLALLDLLDGTRTVGEVAVGLAGRWPTVAAEDVAAAVAGLDEAGLLEDADAPTVLSSAQRERYFSNLEFFGTFASLDRSRFDFQQRLRSSHVVLLGVGGLGSTVLYNLAGLGVGAITLLDCDRVELKNFARQFLYSESQIGRSKLEQAVLRARSFNSEIRLRAVERRVSGPEDVASLLPGADLLISAIDRPPQVQDWVNEACVAAGTPFVTGGMQVARGVYHSVDPGRSGCLACLRVAEDRALADLPPIALPEPVNRGIGPVASMMGSLVALEAARYLTGFAAPVSAGRLWLVDFVTGETGVAWEWSREPDCPACGSLGRAALPEAAAA